MCELRCVTLKFVVDGRPQMRSFVVNNDLQKRKKTNNLRSLLEWKIWQFQLCEM